MAIYANIRDYSFESDVDDIRGSEIYGADDQPLGTISDVIFDTDSGDLQYVVVDAGVWLETKRFLVPAREMRDREHRSGAAIPEASEPAAHRAS